MARYIHCEKCNKEMSASAKEFGEHYESIEGIAKRDMFCDGGCGIANPTPIKKGDKCFVAVLLDSPSHPNYEAQKPESWMYDYIEPKQQ